MAPITRILMWKLEEIATPSLVSPTRYPSSCEPDPRGLSFLSRYRNSATMQFPGPVKNPPWEGGLHKKLGKEEEEEEKVQRLHCYSGRGGRVAI
ncbi:hypothetical protein GW17_00021913 [Ensete ventricosum]|nr:hypothetical protein GW17_00021913 [Ensete ventricosum]